MNAFLKELRHARVYRVAVSYAVASWLVLQLAAIVSPALGLPPWTLAAIIGVLLCGFTAVLWIGWLQDRRTVSASGPPAALRSRRHHLAFAALSVLPAVAVAAGFLVLRRQVWSPGGGPPEAAGAALLEKSIAVLPFDSLSDEKSNAYFAEGIQDEILTDLAKVADLKVISRMSVQAFGPGHARNAREIGQALGVAHLLEGSVQRAAGRVRVTAQLIDTRTDAHLWAEHFDGDLADIFAIQSQMAERIVASLRAQLSSGEKSAIDARPTTDLEAYDLYLQGKKLVANFQAGDWRETLLKAVRLLDEATARDPRFALAWCLAAKAHDQLYFYRLDPTPARLALEENAVAEALRLQPGLGEAHLARALLFYHGRRDPAGARRELEVARAALPNDAEVYSLASYLDLRAGHWPAALAAQERALSLDPRNPTILNFQVAIYDALRLYREEIRTCEAAMAAVPEQADYFRLMKAEALLEAGQRAAARVELDALPASDPGGGTTYTRVCLALEDGRPDEAALVLAAYGGSDYTGVIGQITPRAWLEALVARAAGDNARTQLALAQARAAVEPGVRARPDDPAALALLGQIDAGLGRKEDALHEGRRAVEMRPVSLDAVDGPVLEAALALICAWTDEPDEAMRHLLVLAKIPGGPEYGQLRFDPAWASLRGRPDYQTMLAQLDPHLGP